MSQALSPNTQAILLLTAPLIAGRDKTAHDLLMPAEYRKLAKRLRELNAQPADLLAPAAGQLRHDCRQLIDPSRLERLLARGFLLSQAVERWRARAIWVVSRADAAYPQRLKSRLREDAPAVLYGCGDRTILDSGGLAVVGSRNVDDALIEYTQEIARVAASSRRTLVSGGARGIDQAAMRGALEAGGRVTGVLADSLERTAMRREHRNMLLEDRLVLLSPYDPAAGFNVGHAMQRNKLIYALADAALVVSADRNKGGTWAGATEQLDRLRLVPVFVRTTGGASAGLDALVERGALPWPDPVDTAILETVMATPVPERPTSPEQGRLYFAGPEEAVETEVREAGSPTARPPEANLPPSSPPGLPVPDELFATVRALVLRVVREPAKAADVADRLGVTEAQARKWLKRLVDEGTLSQSKKPVRYSLRRESMSEPGNPVPPATTRHASSQK